MNPRNQSSFVNPPRAICDIVVPMPFEKLSWKTCPPERFSIPKLACVTPGSWPAKRGTT